MQKSKTKENMEAIAMKFLSQNENSKINNRSSISTIKDFEIFGKMTSTTIHTRTRSKVLSIISNNVVIAEYNFDYFNNKKVLYKIPSKVIEDSDVSWEEDIDNIDKDDMDILEESLNEETYDINHESVYRLISELYSPMLNVFSSLDDFANAMQVNTQKIDKWITRTNPFAHLTKLHTEFFDQNLYEIMLIGYVVFFYQITINPGNEIHSAVEREDFEAMFQLLSECLEKLYENVILIISYNISNKPFSQIITFEELCFQYVKEYYKTNFKPSREQIFSKLKVNLNEIKESFSNLTELVINSIYQGVNNALLSSFSNDFVEEITFFEKLILILKKNKDTSPKELKALVIEQYKKFYIIMQQNTIPVPYLPPLDSNKYKYTLVLDLDETLVHYVEEENKAYVQVRPHAEVFITEMGKYFELVIFTAAAEDYADIIIPELDKTNSIAYRLYRKHTIQQNGVYLKDLSKLGRAFKTMCIVDNNRDNYSLQQENGLNISSFIGDQKDNELLHLAKDLMKIISDTVNDDIRPVLIEIRKTMLKRYSSHLK